MKNIRSKVVKQSLLDYNTLAKSLQENTEGAVKNLLSETVRDTYAKLLSEGDEFDEDEVDDVDGGVEDTATDAGNSDDADIDTGDDSDIDAGTDADAADDIEDGEGADADGDDWAEFDKYKVSDDEYDFSNAEDEEIVKVYKLMKNDDQILVHKDDDKVKIQDNETGAEYIVDLGGDDSASFDSDDEFDGGEDFDDDEDIDGGESDFELEAGDDSDDDDFDDDADLDSDMAEFGDDDEDFDDEDFDDEEGEDTFELETDDDGEDIEDEDDFSDEDSDDNNEDEKDNMKESTERMFELVLEYKSDLGYTDNYQNKDVMTTPDMSEPGKNVNDWDAGVPKGKSKPWSGKKGGKKENQPFDGEKGKTVEEGAVNELKTNAEHSANVGSTSRTDGPNNPRGRKGRSFHTAQNGQETGTGDNAYKKSGNGGANNVDIDIKVENTLRKINKTLKENKELKNTLGTVMTSLKEAAVTNHNLAQIIKLISENSTTREEKEEIIRKFANEAKTIDASKALYESLSNDLKKAKKMNITEGALFSAESSKKINETPIYKSQDIMESLDLMHRMMK
jgi:hypothetical protein